MTTEHAAPGPMWASSPRPNAGLLTHKGLGVGVHQGETK